MSQGQGPISYNGPASSGGGGGAVAGARNGVSLDTGSNVVLGENIGAGGLPAALLSDREIPMGQQELDFYFQASRGWNFTVHLANGNIGNDVPTLWRSLTSSYWSQWWPGNFLTDYTPWGTQDMWTSGYSIYPGVNEPTTPRPNVVGMFWGYNTTYQQGRWDGTEPAFRYATESFYIIGADDHFEFHTPEITTTGGTIFRLDSNYVQRQTGLSFRELVCDNVQLFSTGYNPSGGLSYAVMEYNPSADVAATAYHCQLPGGVCGYGFNNNTLGGLGSFLNQDGLGDIVANVDIDLHSPRVIMDSTFYGNVVNPTIFSGSNIDSPVMDAWLEVGGSTHTKGSRPVPSMTTVEWTAFVPNNINNPCFVWVSDAVAGTQLKFWDGAAWHFVNFT